MNDTFKLFAVHIDNNHFELSARAAKALCVTGRLPKHGMETRASAKALARLELFQEDGRHEWGDKAKDATSAWVMRTVRNGKQLWCIHVRWAD